MHRETLRSPQMLETTEQSYNSEIQTLAVVIAGCKKEILSLLWKVIHNHWIMEIQHCDCERKWELSLIAMVPGRIVKTKRHVEGIFQNFVKLKVKCLHFRKVKILWTICGERCKGFAESTKK